jgi:hypothetical protein
MTTRLSFRHCVAMLALLSSATAWAAGKELPGLPTGDVPPPPPKGFEVPPPLTSPVAPGSVQPQPGVRIDPTDRGPRMWVFADITATVLGPTGARVAWTARDGATSYRVLRDGAVIADVTPGAAPITLVDPALEPGRSYAYKVQALQAAPTMAAAPTAKSTRGGGYVREPNGGATLTQPPAVLEESNVAWAATPPLAPAVDLTASVVGPNAVRLNLKPPPWAKSFQVWRDKQLIRQNVAGFPFDDTAIPPGSHTYAVQATYARLDGSPLPGPISKEVTIRVGPFTMLAFGDSVMWGQGLIDPPVGSHKFAPKVRDWLTTQMGKPVQLFSFAHSGAVITPGTSTQEAPSMMTPGEMPNSFPSITNQVTALSRGVVPNSLDVDLVLVDGCINDIGVAFILNPTSSRTAIIDRTREKCSAMTTLLGQIHTAFPRARIVVTGYFPIVSQASDLTAVTLLLLHVGAMAAPAAIALGIPIDPVTGLITTAVTSKVLKDTLVDHSYAFLTESNAQLGAAAAAANAAMKGDFVSFAPIPYLEQNAYASPQSWLWLVPTDLYPKDEVFTQRLSLCQNTALLARTEPPGTDLTGTRAKCIEASMGHPNVEGAQAYTDAVISRLKPMLPSWTTVHAANQSAQ